MILSICTNTYVSIDNKLVTNNINKFLLHQLYEMAWFKIGVKIGIILKLHQFEMKTELAPLITIIIIELMQLIYIPDKNYNN